MDGEDKIRELIDGNIISAHQQIKALLLNAAENSRALLDLSIVVRTLEESREKFTVKTAQECDRLVESSQNTE